MYWIVYKGHHVEPYSYARLLSSNLLEYGLDPETQWCVVEAYTEEEAISAVLNKSWPEIVRKLSEEVLNSAALTWHWNKGLTVYSLVELAMVKGILKGLNDNENG